MKRIANRRLLRWALVVLAGVLGIVYWRVPHSPQPVSVAVPGGDAGGLPRATPESEGLDAVAVQRAVDYARNNGAQALLLTRHGHLLVEHYGAGMDAHSGVDGGAFAELLAALATGVAVRDYGMSDPQGAPGSDALAAGVVAASHLSYPQFLSRNLWQPMNAAPARIMLPAAGARTPAGCCFVARPIDWLRVAELMIADGRFEGTQVLPAGWAARMQRASGADPGRAFGVWLAASAHGAEPYLAHDVVFVRGLGGTRMWMAPHQQLAILLVDQRAANGSSDETRLPNMIFRALREAPPGTHLNIGDLVPNH